MKKKVFIISLFTLMGLISCKEKVMWSNKDFEAAVDSYCNYVDSAGYKHNFDYIHIKAEQNKNTIMFSVHLTGGAYRFLNESNEIIDFLTYKGHDILLVGDFPNAIVNIKKNRKLNIINDIVKKRYPKDYERYLNKVHSVMPLTYDYMDITLIFKGDKLISCKRQYY